MDYLDEESRLLGRGLMDELDMSDLETRTMPRLVKQSSFESTGSGTSGYSSGDLLEYESQTECVTGNRLVAACLDTVKGYQLEGAPRMGTPTLEIEAQIQCKYKELGLPDKGTPGPRLLERYSSRCPQSQEAISKIQNTIGVFLDAGVQFKGVQAVPYFGTTYALPVTYRKYNFIPAQLLQAKIPPSFSLLQIDDILENCQDLATQVKEARKTLEGLFNLISPSFSKFSKQALPQPLNPPKRNSQQIFNLINLVDFEYGALLNLLGQMINVVFPLSEKTRTLGNELRKNVNEWRKMNMDVEKKYYVSTHYNLPLLKVPDFSRVLTEYQRVTEAVQCQLKEYGYRIYLESQSFIDRVTEINKLNESH